MTVDPERDLVARAVAYAFDHHGSTLDKGGRLYMLHPVRVMQDVENVWREFVDERGLDDHDLVILRAAAVLHDVVEDTSATLEDVEWLFGIEVAEVVDSVTRPSKDESYGDFITRSNHDFLGRLVKIADVRDNLGRIESLPPEKEAFLQKRYERALRVLEDPTRSTTWETAR